MDAMRLVQISNRPGLPEFDNCRRPPSVPREAPQWRHLIGVEDGAPSTHSKVMPRPSQALQMISNRSGRLDGICMAALEAGFALNDADTRHCRKVGRTSEKMSGEWTLFGLVGLATAIAR